MDITFTTKYSGTVPADTGFKQRTWNNVVRMAWVAVGKYWHRNFRPKHFTEAGAREYGYAKRGAEYEQRKKREVGHNLPLVWSGDSRDATAQGRIKAHATRNKSGVKVSMPAGSLNFGGRRWGGPELTKISAVEMQQLVHVLDSQIDRLLRRYRRKRTKTIR